MSSPATTTNVSPFRYWIAVSSERKASAIVLSRSFDAGWDKIYEGRILGDTILMFDLPFNTFREAREAVERLGFPNPLPVGGAVYE